MSTKRLARTVIEGGRYRFNKLLRRRSHKLRRHTDREFLRRLLVDPDFADDASPAPLERVGRCFYDKLAPMRRWLSKTEAGTLFVIFVIRQVTKTTKSVPLHGAP